MHEKNANIFFSNTNRTNLTNLLGCDIVYIRGIRGQVNIIHTRIYFFSNTNRTNRTNLLGCDMVYIRGIRGIRGQVNIIHARIYFFRTLIGRIERIFILHSHRCIALCKPAATELESKNAHGVSPIYFGVFSRIRFLIISF